MTIKEWYQVSSPYSIDPAGMMQYAESLNVVLLDISQRFGELEEGTDVTISSANLHLSGTLEVDGATILSSGLAVTGNISVTGTVDGVDIANHTHEGTAILSTGEGGASKFLREDGDGTSSWQTAGGGGLWTDNGTDISVTGGEDLHMHTTNQQLLISHASGGGDGIDITDTGHSGVIRVVADESLNMTGTVHYYTNQTIARRSGAGATGHRVALLGQQIVADGTTASEMFVGVSAYSFITSGTGWAFGSNPYARVYAAALDTASCVGEEINTDAQGTVANKIGLQIVDVATSVGAVTPGGRDAAIWIAKQHDDAKGYKYGIHFAKVTSEDPIFDNHFHSDGDLISNVPTGESHFFQVNNSNVMSIGSTALATTAIIHAGSEFWGGGDNNAALLRLRSGASNISLDWDGTNFIAYLDGVSKGAITHN